MDLNHGSQAIYDLCKDHMHAYVLAELTDQSRFDGIITGLDREYVYFAVPVEHHASSPSHREWRGGGYNQTRRRFNRILVPLSALSNIQSLPWY